MDVKETELTLGFPVAATRQRATGVKRDGCSLADRRKLLGGDVEEEEEEVTSANHGPPSTAQKGLDQVSRGSSSPPLLPMVVLQSINGGNEIEECGGGGGETVAESGNPGRKKPGGWKTMPFILGNETFERLASFSLLANFMVYLTREYHMNQVFAANLVSVWSGVSNFAPVVGAFLSDAYFGRFPVIAISSFAAFLVPFSLLLLSFYVISEQALYLNANFDV